MDSEPNTCKNCGHKTEAAYCSNCGQRTSVFKVTFRETFNDLVEQLFTLSAPLPVTVKLMVINPGKLFREFLAGRRRRYYKPISFFLLATLLYLFLRWLIDFNTLGQVIGNPSDNPLIETTLLNQARDFMFKNINNLLFIFVGVLACVMKLFFYKRYKLSEYLAVSFYLVGFYTLLASVNIFYIQYVNRNIQYLASLAMFIYFVYAAVSFFQLRKWVVILKSLVIYLLSYILYLLLAYNFSYLIIAIKQS